MNAKEYSLKYIFVILREATVNLQKDVVLTTQDKDGKDIKIQMKLPDYIAMSVGYQITNDSNDEVKKDVIEAMAAAGYEEVAYPNYEHFGIIMRGGGGGTKHKRKLFRKKTKTRKRKEIDV